MAPMKTLLAVAVAVNGPAGLAAMLALGVVIAVVVPAIAPSMIAVIVVAAALLMARLGIGCGRQSKRRERDTGGRE